MRGVPRESKGEMGCVQAHSSLEESEESRRWTASRRGGVARCG